MADFNPYASQQAAIARQQKMADILQQQAFKPQEAGSYNGIPAALPAWGGLAKALQGYMSGRMASNAAKGEEALASTRQADRTRDMGKLAALMQDQPAHTNAPDQYAEYQPTPDTPARPGGVSYSDALTFTNPDTQALAMGLAKSGTERTQVVADNLLKAKQLAEQHADDAAARVALAEQNNATRETIASLVADAANARAVLNSVTQQLLQDAKGGTAVNVAGIGANARIEAANIGAGANRYRTDAQAATATDRTALSREQVPLRLQNTLDVQGLRNQGGADQANIAAGANRYRTDAQAAAAQATDATRRWLPPLQFQNNLDVQGLRNQGGVDQANIQAQASQAAAGRAQEGREETARHNAATEYLAAVEVWNKTGEWHGPPGTPPPAGVAGSPERAAAMQQAQVPLIVKDLNDQGKVADASVRAWKDLEQIKALSTTSPQGSLAAAQLGLGKFFSSFNIQIDQKAANAGAMMQSAIADMLQNQMHALGARGLTDQDMKILKDNLPQLRQSADARVAVANVLQKAELSTMSEYNNLLTGYRAQVPGLVHVDPLWLKDFTAGKFNSPDAAPAGAPQATPAAAAAAKNRQAIFDAADDVLGGR